MHQSLQAAFTRLGGNYEKNAALVDRTSEIYGTVSGKMPKKYHQLIPTACIDLARISLGLASPSQDLCSKACGGSNKNYSDAFKMMWSLLDAPKYITVASVAGVLESGYAVKFIEHLVSAYEKAIEVSRDEQPAAMIVSACALLSLLGRLKIGQVCSVFCLDPKQLRAVQVQMKDRCKALIEKIKADPNVANKRPEKQSVALVLEVDCFRTPSRAQSPVNEPRLLQCNPVIPLTPFFEAPEFKQFIINI